MTSSNLFTGLQFIDPLNVPKEINLLREYIYYYKVNYEKNCINKDEYLKGTLGQSQFRHILNKFVYPFTNEELELIIEMSPKNYDKDIQYKVFFNAIRRLSRPRTQLSLERLLSNAFEFYEKFETISAENYFNLKQSYDLRSYQLPKLNYSSFRSSSNDEDLESFNNTAIVDNFVVKLSRDFFRTLKAVYPNQQLTEGLVFKQFSIKNFEKDSFISP